METQARTNGVDLGGCSGPQPVINPSPQALCLRFCPVCAVSPPAHTGLIHWSCPETQSFTELFTDTSLSESFERGWRALHPMAHPGKPHAFQQTQGSEKSCTEDKQAKNFCFYISLLLGHCRAIRFHRTGSRNMDRRGVPALGQGPTFPSCGGLDESLRLVAHFALNPKSSQKLPGQGALLSSTLSSPRASALVASPITPGVASVTGSRERWWTQEWRGVHRPLLPPEEMWGTRLAPSGICPGFVRSFVL